MTGAELAGRLRDRVVILRQAATRDAAGGAAGAWAEIASPWAWIASDGEQRLADAEARSALALWRVTMRPGAVAVGDRIVWNGLTMAVRAVRRDPALPDRISAIGEELR